MEKAQYQDFKQWLINSGKIEECPDAVSYLFSINRFLQKRICGLDLFQIIQGNKYSLLFDCRNHWEYRQRKVNAPIREQVMRLAFEYLGRSFDSYIQYEAERIFSSCTKPHTLYLHQGNIACLRYKHPIDDVAASIAVAGNMPLRVHASYCRKCNAIFMHKSFYKQLRKQYPFIVANFCEISEDGYTLIPPGKMAAESPLKLCGYTVEANKLTDAQRHQLLCDIIYNGILSKTEIINYLEHFLIFNAGGKRMHLAAMKWECDLDYVRNLDLEQHPVVPVTDIRPYSSR